jgi:FkbM family methyltransferase
MGLQAWVAIKECRDRALFRLGRRNSKGRKSLDISPFFLMKTFHGSIIVNRFDELSPLWGVGSQIMRRGCYDLDEVNLTKILLEQCRDANGIGVVALDCGANIGVHSIEWGRLMRDWGKVFSFEAQLPVYYALCGGIVLNGCLNVFARHMAIGKHDGIIDVPNIDYSKPSSFGSLELLQRDNPEWIGQKVDYSDTYKVIMKAIDSFHLKRVDLIKIDVEGMEEHVLKGAILTLEKCKPFIYFEHSKSDKPRLELFLSNLGYKILYLKSNALAIHGDSNIKLGAAALPFIDKLFDARSGLRI